MNVEQRVSIRIKIPLNILINRDLTYSEPRKIRDLSLNGALVEIGQGDLVPGTPIEAVIALKDHDEFDSHRLPAEVVRADHNGVAVRFRDYDNWAYTALVNLLYSA